MSSELSKFNFRIVHVGVNCADETEAIEGVRFMEMFFGLPENPDKRSLDSLYTDTTVEWLTKPGRGKHGHLAIATNDLEGAQAFLEEKGLTFDPDSRKYTDDGRVLVIYAEQDIAGFAVHLLQE